MPNLFRLALIGHFLGTLGFAADPIIDLRLLQTDQPTASFLQKALEDGKLTSAQIEDRLDAMVKARTLFELARFKQQFSPDGQRLNFEKDRVPIKVGDGENIPGGLSIELESNIGHTGLVDLLFSFERSIEQGRNKITVERTNTSATIKNERWEILSAWGNEKQTTLLLARVSGVRPKENMTASRLLEVHYRTEIRWCQPSDLKTFARASPATRAKAVAWLLGKSELIATSNIRKRSGQRAAQDNGLHWIHNDNGWDTKILGWSLELQSIIGPNGKLIDFQLYSSWHPQDAKRPPSKPDFSFEFTTTAESGSTLVIKPKTLPDTGPIPVIFITPKIHFLADTQNQHVNGPLPKEGELGTAIYPVHPSLIRKLAELTRFDPKAQPGLSTSPNIKDLLEKLGLEFPAGTTAAFDSSDSQVILQHHRQGHRLLQSILRKNNLLIPDIKSD